MNQFGTGRIQINVDEQMRINDSALDLLVPIYQQKAKHNGLETTVDLAVGQHTGSKLYGHVREASDSYSEFIFDTGTPKPNTNVKDYRIKTFTLPAGQKLQGIKATGDEWMKSLLFITVECTAPTSPHNPLPYQKQPICSPICFTHLHIDEKI